MKRFFILMIGVLMMASVFAWGVSPARTTLDFEAGMEKEVSFEVINSDNEDLDISFFAQGDLAEYISLPTSSSSLSSGEDRKSFSYTLNLPSNLEPGAHTGDVVVMQTPKGTDSDDSQISATLAVITQVRVYVSYPGKYATAKLYAYDSAPGEPVRFVIPVVNVGKFDLTSVRASVDVYNKMGGKIDSFEMGPIEIANGGRKELVYDYEGDLDVGEYFVEASVIYDEDGLISLEESFSVGGENLELLDISVDDFSLGQIAKLEMLVENKWSEAISGVYIDTKIIDKDGDVVSDFESAAQDVESLSKKSFASYWDTDGVFEGEYDAEVSINYGDKSSRKDLRFEVSDNELVVVGLGYVVSSEAKGEGMSTTVVVLTALVVLLILMNLFWFFIFRKKFSKK